MIPLQIILSDLIRSIVQRPDKVMVKEVEGFPVAFEITLSHRDYNQVLSKLTVIKTLAGRFADFPEGQQMIIQLVAI